MTGPAGSGTGTVLVTGAAGEIGRVVVPGLAELGWTVRGTDLVPLPGGLAAAATADLTDPAADAVLADLLDGADAVVHLAGIPREDTWDRIAAANVDTTERVLRAARAAGVRRAVLASSNHATGFTRRPADGAPLPADAPPRPDTHYGVSKVAMEALGALHVERYGTDVVALRIGSFLPRPRTVRHLATWLSPGDAVRLVHAALTAPAPGFALVWGVSANTRSWWSAAEGRALGYEPVDDAEEWAGELLAGAEPDWSGDDELALVGGEFATREGPR